jgi:hypothetical protein
LAVVAVVVAVVSGFGVVVEVDDDAPQPAATSARQTAGTGRVFRELIRILDKG